MKTFSLLCLTFISSVNALPPRTGPCCFHISANGGVSGILGQLSDGQNRVGGHLPEGQFCIDSSGGLTDSHGRGCIIAGPETQFQCDEGKKPMGGFSISYGNIVSYNGNSSFTACATGQNDEENIYIYGPEGAGPACKPIGLTASGCNFPYGHPKPPGHSYSFSSAYSTSYPENHWPKPSESGSGGSVMDQDLPRRPHVTRAHLTIGLCQRDLCQRDLCQQCSLQDIFPLVILVHTANPASLAIRDPLVIGRCFPHQLQHMVPRGLNQGMVRDTVRDMVQDTAPLDTLIRLVIRGYSLHQLQRIVPRDTGFQDTAL
ncbi:MAG: hypothetical protein M1834_006525 [Cirrosporium novae-zelandiae]|nr:MAG: hypothetical protein M1834_006525 [Cirrosporium novae-zelandiae]